MNREDICRRLKNYIDISLTFENITNSLLVPDDVTVNLIVYIISSEIYSDPKQRRKLQLIRYKYGYNKTSRMQKILVLDNVRIKDVKSILKSSYTISIVTGGSNLDIIGDLSNISFTSITFDKYPKQLKRTINYYKIYRELKKGNKEVYKVPWAIFLETRNKYSVAVLHPPTAKDQILSFLTKWRAKRNKIKSILSDSGILYSC